jgi:ankyrin repeat protein
MDLPKFTPSEPGASLKGMPLWLTNQRVIVGLVGIAVVGTSFLAWSILGTSSQADGTNADLNPPASQPSYRSTYPIQIFKTQSTPRNTVYTSNPDGVGSTTFRGLSADDVKNFVSTMQNDPPSAVTKMNQRAYLAKAGYSWTPEGFLEAARQGDVNALRAFLVAGMDVNSRNAFSSTALHAAAEANQLAAVKLLLAAGADLESATNTLQTPLHRAVANNLPAMTQLLITAGARIDSATLEGWTPLFYAVDNNNKKLVEYLLAAGSKPNLSDKFGNTPLILAIRKNYVDTATRLIGLGANVNARDITGRTALHYAVSKGYYQAAKMLLQNGSKADIKDLKGILPMDIALANQDLSIANLLLASGSRRSNALGKPTGAKSDIDPNIQGKATHHGK